MFLAELLDRNPAAPLHRDSVGPLVCFRVGRLRLDDSIAHDTTMQRRPVRQEERFTSVHETLTEFGRGRDGFLQWPDLAHYPMRNRERLERLGHFVGGECAAFFSCGGNGVRSGVSLSRLDCADCIHRRARHDDGSGGQPKTCGREFLFVDFVGPRARRRREGQLVQSVASKGQEKGKPLAPRFIA